MSTARTSITFRDGAVPSPGTVLFQAAYTVFFPPDSNTRGAPRLLPKPPFSAAFFVPTVQRGFPVCVSVASRPDSAVT